MQEQLVAGSPVREWKIAGVVLSVGVVAALTWFYTSTPRVELPPTLAERMAVKGHPFASISDEDALRFCQRAITQAARDPASAKVPDVEWMKGGADWRFNWSTATQMVRMKNGIGAEVATDALCVVDEQTAKIKLLVLDGRQLISPDQKP